MRRGIRERLQAAVRAKGMWNASSEALAELRLAIEHKLAEETIDCAPGCHYCCRQRVDVSRTELAAIADHVDANYDDARRAALLVRLEGMSAKTAGKTAMQYPEENCAFVETDGTCGIYEARPIACASAHSTDRDACERGDPDEGIPAIVEVLMGTASIQTGFRDGINRFDGERYELQSAAHVIVANRLDARAKEAERLLRHARAVENAAETFDAFMRANKPK